MALENFTTYTEVDTGNDRIQKTAYHIDHHVTLNEDTYVYKDYGVNHFGDFEHKVDCRIVDILDGLGGIWMLSNDLDDFKGLQDGGKTAILVFTHFTPRIYLREYHTGNEYNDFCAILDNTWYYLRIKKDGTALTCRIWTDSGDRDNNDVGAGSYVDELSLTLQADHSFRYVFGCVSWNGGVADRNADNDIENLDLQEAVTKPSGSIVPLMQGMGLISLLKRFPKVPNFIPFMKTGIG